MWRVKDGGRRHTWGADMGALAAYAYSYPDSSRVLRELRYSEPVQSVPCTMSGLGGPCVQEGDQRQRLLPVWVSSFSAPQTRGRGESEGWLGGRRGQGERETRGGRHTPSDRALACKMHSRHTYTLSTTYQHGARICYGHVPIVLCNS